MHREIFEVVLQSTIPKSAFLNEVDVDVGSRLRIQRNPNKPSKSFLKSGTTVLAFHFDRGVILAGDRQTSSGFSIMSQESIKIDQISSHSALLQAGLVSDCQALVKDLRRVNSDFLGKFGMPLSIDGQANCLSHLMRTYYLYGSWLEAWLIIAGINVDQPTFKIYSIEPSGSKLDHDFATEGSGGDKAESELEKFKGKIKARSLGIKEATKLAVRAVYMAGKKDLGTSDVRLAVPTVAVITVKGFGFLNQKVVDKIRDRLIEQERKYGNVA